MRHYNRSVTRVTTYSNSLLIIIMSINAPIVSCCCLVIWMVAPAVDCFPRYKRNNESYDADGNSFSAAASLEAGEATSRFYGLSVAGSPLLPSLFSHQPPLLGLHPPNSGAFGNQPYPNYGGVLVHPSTLTSLGVEGFYPSGQQIRPHSPLYGPSVPQGSYTQVQHGSYPINPYPNIGAFAGSSSYQPGTNKPYNPSSQQYPINLYNPSHPISSSIHNPVSAYPINTHNPSPYPVNAFNPSSSYPTNPYKPPSSYPNNHYNPSLSYPTNNYNPSSYPSSSYKPIAASVQQQPYKPTVIPDPFQPVYNQDTSSYNQGLPYKPIVVIESQYNPSTSSASTGSAYNNNKPYESIVVQSAAYPYNKNPSSSSYSSYKPSGLGSTYSNRPTGQGTIQEILTDDDVPIYIPNKNPSHFTSAASKVAFPAD